MSYKLNLSAEAIDYKLNLIDKNKNLLPYPYDNNTAFPTGLENVGDGSILTYGGSIPGDKREIVLNTCSLPGGKKYIVSLDITNILEEAITDLEGFALKIAIEGEALTDAFTFKELDFSSKTGETSITVYLFAPTTFSANLLIKPQIEEGTKKTTWVPYMDTIGSYVDERFNSTNAKIKVLSESLGSDLDKFDLVVQNSISMGRKEGSTVGEKSTAIGVDVKATNYVTSAEGYATVAGSFGFRITSIESGCYIVEDPDEQLAIFSIGGQNVDFSVITKDNYDLAGKMQQCYVNEPENGLTRIYVDSVVGGELVSNPTGSSNTIRFPDYPELGYIQIGSYSHAEGYEAQAQSSCAHAEGYKTVALGKYSHAEGRDTKAAYAAHAEGKSTLAKGQYSHAEGVSTSAIGYAAHAEGSTTVASGSGAHAEGQETQAIGIYTHAEGHLTKAIGDYCHAEGDRTTSETYAAHAEGYYTVTKAWYAHAEGDHTNATAHAAHAEGIYITSGAPKGFESGTTASGAGAHAEGANTISSGTASHSEGAFTIASASQAHAEGNQTKATSDCAHAEGYLTTASGQRSHAEGWGCEAAGIASHAGGISSKAIGLAAFAHGQSVNAANGQFVVGSHNLASDDAIFIVGNGGGSESPSNAFEVLKDGSIKIGNTVLTEDMLKTLLEGNNLVSAEEVRL